MKAESPWRSRTWDAGLLPCQLVKATCVQQAREWRSEQARTASEVVSKHLSYFAVVLVGPKSLPMAWRLSNPLSVLAETLHTHRHQIFQSGLLQNTSSQVLDDCTEQSGQHVDWVRVIFLAKMGRLWSPHCMSSTKKANSVGDGGLVLCPPQSKYGSMHSCNHSDSRERLLVRRATCCTTTSRFLVRGDLSSLFSHEAWKFSYQEI